MLSLIICSRNPSLSDVVIKNIHKTIGVDYEIIVINNSEHDKTIFQAYNEGISKSNGEILCFMHEDVEFLSEGWGNKVISYFCNDSMGVLGVIGGHCLPACPCSWWSAGINSGRIWQGEELQEYLSYKEENETSIQVATVDGLWMCIPKRVFNTISFDEENFNGFHSYDTDICLQLAHKGYEIRVAFDIDIRHNSTGVINRQYFEARNILFGKWKNALPLVRGVKLRENELEERTQMTIRFNEAEEALYRLSKVYESKAYQLGNALAQPIRFLKKNRSQ